MSGNEKNKAFRFGNVKDAVKGIRLNTLHRYVGVVIAPFLVVQTLSGLLLSLMRFGRVVSDEVPTPLSAWHQVLARVHFGPGLLTLIYHLLLGVGIVWMAVSGWNLYLRIRRGRNRRPPA